MRVRAMRIVRVLDQQGDIANTPHATTSAMLRTARTGWGEQGDVAMRSRYESTTSVERKMNNR